MVTRPRLALLLAALLVLLCALPATATTYLFEVPSLTVDLWPQTDGALKVRYKFIFKNLSSDPLDIVDIGTPTGSYKLSTFSASINGAPLTEIRESEYVTGVEVHLAPFAIKQNRTGTFVVEFIHPRMVFYDSGDEAFTSVEFGTTYFGSEYVRGSTDMTINWHFPAGVTGNQTKWHDKKPDAMRAEGNSVVFTYRGSHASVSSMVKTGVGFPAAIMAEGAIVKHTFWDSLLEMFVACCGLAASLVPLAIFAAIFFIAFFIPFVRRRRRLKKYLPPAIGIEGAGPKRGLTAPEAAVTLELPPDRILMMILFGLIKKGAVRVLDHDPLKLEAIEPAPKGLRAYETRFLGAILPSGSLAQKKLKALFVSLVKAVNKKLGGFSRQETRAYYQKIVTGAWAMVEANTTPEVGNVFAEKIEWLAFDGDFGDRSGRAFRDRDVIIVPNWWGVGWGYHGPSTPIGHGGGGFHLPAADAAANFTDAVSNFSSHVVDSVSSFTNSITQATNPPPVTTSSGSSSGGGCACACACAGCACACAGGGR
jgi:hypothetical protein